jgi:hypothetical protein
MHPDRTRSHDPAGLKPCSVCGEEKRAADFYESGGRISSYCKDCQRQASRAPTADAVRTRLHEPGCAASIAFGSARSVRAWPSSTPTESAVPPSRRLIAAHEPEYLTLLEQELVTQGGGQDG